MEVLNDILGYENLKIYQNNDFFSFSLDSVMLANFIDIRTRDKKILDLGTGNGVIPLVLSKRTNSNIIGLEIQKDLSDLASKSVRYNKLQDRIDIININMKDYVTNDVLNTFDLITCNPPYFKYNENNIMNDSLFKLIARHEVEITLSDIFSIAKRLLTDGGKFAIVHSPERLLEIIDQFRKNNIEPKRIRFVYENINKNAIIVLIEGIKNGRCGLKVESPFILYDETENKTLEYENFIMEVRK